jgi:DNA-binding SARP family transcriptional activator
VLGPLEVVDDDGVPLQLGGPRPRALLAQLLLCANQAVSTDRLIDAVWGETPPASAPGALQVHVHALRKALGADRIATRAPGYLVRVEPGELDSERFERLAASGADGIREALALWRGPALADLAYEAFAQAEASRLEEARLAAPTSTRAGTPRSPPSSSRSSPRTPTASSSAPTRWSRSTGPGARRTRSPRTGAHARRSTSSGSSPRRS